ncbi:uncharacterized protein SPPG_06926 [Spizellomyces punctatus DAOM BR117]|uniref:Uncharacterized protein n=1 Tax=Spizellomyces punctatus (strain DAOM BR117) TaxID=645134 RepID=A0A0L0HB41_SPIPD|nr:uncharacterized protein SPPG_06926 [Spizellomyces punctatus DAOM BR117]KNC97938.1 hypothetical protein SPPG_06926 [Spizellomyces punctatus DAOM BR117]|eukprot:XP_016605978.1 hypothetical protein SPPG_06926 [Spizellomyces punctatus DAOM BR117]
MPPNKKQKLDNRPTCLHSCNKTSFAKAFLPNETYRQRLLDYIAIIHQLADHASHALKFYLLSAPTFPTVNEDTIEGILYLLNKGEAWHPRKEAKKAWRDSLLPYVQRYCQIVGFVHPNLRGEQQSINYLTASMMTNLKVNVQEHFMTMLLRYINLRLDVKGRKGQFPPKSEVRKAFFARLRYLKSIFLFDVVPESLDDLTAEESELLEEMWSLDLPFLPNNPLAYAIVADPMSFFPAYCKLSGLYERYGFRRFSAIPLRRSLIQSHVRIDTIILYQHILCITRPEAEAVEKDDLWLRVCNLCTKAFRSRRGMQFEGSITTDGTSVSVYLKHPDADKYGRRGGGKKSAKTMEAEVKAVYVENNLPACRAAENIVVIDPNKRDILYCQDSNGATMFRYTANQRCRETGSRQFAKRREAMKKEAGIDLIDSRIPSPKTMNLMDFMRYLLVRRADWDRRKEFYSHPAHTRWKWHSFINRQRSESDLISNMRDKFGNFTVVMGDWSDAGRTAKFQTSSKTKGWRILFRRNRINCFLIDEHKTSSVCPRCLASYNDFLEKDFKQRPHSRPWRRREGKVEDVHGLLGCTNPNCLQQDWTTMRYWNRDTLATCNMLTIVQSMLDGHGRPERFSRSVPAIA